MTRTIVAALLALALTATPAFARCYPCDHRSAIAKHEFERQSLKMLPGGQ